MGILIGLERLKLLIARREARAEKTEDGTQGEEEAQSGGSPKDLLDREKAGESL
ncbi:MAG: hypothetical protein ACLR1T_17710 [Evtepia gabavorous]